jgi:hypothetical protein
MLPDPVPASIATVFADFALDPIVTAWVPVASEVSAM